MTVGKPRKDGSRDTAIPIPLIPNFAIPHPLILNLLKEGRHPPYRRVRRTFFSQVALQSTYW